MTDERVGSRSRSRRVALDPASAESYVFGEWWWKSERQSPEFTQVYLCVCAWMCACVYQFACAYMCGRVYARACVHVCGRAFVCISFCVLSLVNSITNTYTLYWYLKPSSSFSFCHFAQNRRTFQEAAEEFHAAVEAQRLKFTERDQVKRHNLNV